MSEDQPVEPDQLLHDIRQPLNVIRLTGGNIRSRLLPLLDESSGAYLEGKLDRIEEQVQRAAELIERYMADRHRRG
jgi:signal transduction histidine kinase